MLSHGIVRRPGDNFADGETSADSAPPDYATLIRQHDLYVAALEACGLEIIHLDPLADYPDAYFVEDTAVVAPEFAVITRPGASTRRGEEQHMETALVAYRETIPITPPGTLDGGDVMQVDSTFYVGLSQRTNAAGASQFGRIVETYGYSWITIPVPAGLHLKSSVSYIGNNTLVVTTDLASTPAFRGFERIVLGPDEAYAANALFVNGRVIVPDGFPSVVEKLAKHDCIPLQLDMSEARKMDGGLTCMSLRF